MAFGRLLNAKPVLPTSETLLDRLLLSTDLTSDLRVFHFDTVPYGQLRGVIRLLPVECPVGLENHLD